MTHDGPHAGRRRPALSLLPRFLLLALIAAAALAPALPLVVAPAPALAQSAEPAPGERVLVRLKTGETIAGELVSRSSDAVVLSIAGIETAIQRQHIERITRERTPAQRYRSMRAIIDDDDIPRLLLLVEWLMQNDLLTEARAELDAVLDQEPANPAAQKLDRTLNQRIKLAERSSRAEPRDAEQPGAPRPERTPVVPPGRFAPGEFPLLTDEQINLYKVYETDLADPPRLIIERPVVERFLTSYAGAAGLPRTEAQRDLFFRKPPAQILELMFALRARELYTDVRVLDLPASLEAFRDNVAGAWLTRNCGSTNCHGGTDAPPPYLFNRRPFSETTVLTNLLILERFRFPNGEPMIDYAHPEESPLLQLALPRPNSSRPHPEASGWRPALRSRDVPRFRQAVEWMNQMIRPRPNIPIDYTPPAPATPSDDPARSDQDENPAQPRDDQPR